MYTPAFRLQFGRLLAFLACGVVVGLTTFPSRLVGSELRRSAIVKAVEGAQPSVVNIHGRKTIRDDVGGENFNQVNGMGTGVIIDERGYIITNYHVVEGVGRIQVTLHDKRSRIGRLVAHDRKTDMAIVKIPTDAPLPVVKIGTSSDLLQGETVIAVGNAYGYEDTVTRGIISALHRTVQVSDEQQYRDLIQTDASINPGNSGGPLLNIDGEMIGINVAVRVGAQGIGFAIPVDEVMVIAARLLNAERIGGMWHGVEGKSVFGESGAQFIVTSVQPNSPAARAGIHKDDVIEAVGDTQVKRSLDFERGILHSELGEEISVAARRKEELLKLSLVVRGAPRVAESPQDDSWQQLGLRLKPLAKTNFQRMNTRFRGGLSVVAVRPDSPAAAEGIQPGDVLVGMHVWETVKLQDVAYILSRPDLKQLQPLKFFIVRDNEPLYGHLQVSVAAR